MRLALQLCAWIIGLPLQLMVIAALVRGAYRRYLLVFAYTIAAFLIAVAEIPVVLARLYGEAEAPSSLIEAIHKLSKMYWVDDVILEILLYALVINLIYKATARMQPRALVRLILTAGALIFAGVSLWLHYNPDPGVRGEWMNVWTRDLSFCSTVLDLALWTVLISTHEKDSRLLMISGGLGIQFAGSAIGDAVQDLALRAYHSHTFSRTWAEIMSRSGAIFSVITGFACLYIWWRAFRVPEDTVSKQALMAGTTRRKT